MGSNDDPLSGCRATDSQLIDRWQKTAAAILSYVYIIQRGRARHSLCLYTSAPVMCYIHMFNMRHYPFPIAYSVF
jgi:hypothetical protein